MQYLTSTFTFNAASQEYLERGGQCTFKAISDDDARLEVLLTDWESAVGHQDTATIMSKILHKEVPMNRVSLSVNSGDVFLIWQYRGPRLAEGTKELPKDAPYCWLMVKFY